MAQQLRIQHCYYCNLGQSPGLETSPCHRHKQKQKQTKKQKKQHMQDLDIHINLFLKLTVLKKKLTVLVRCLGNFQIYICTAVFSHCLQTLLHFVPLEDRKCHFFLSSFFFFLLFRATPVTYGSSQARGQIGATAAGLHHNHSNPSCVCDLHHQILNPLSKAKD